MSSESVEYVAPWIYVISIVLIAAAVICSIGSWVFVFCYRKEPIVAMGQPPFLYNLCFGALLLPIGIAFGVAVNYFNKNEKGIIPVDSKNGILLTVGCHLTTWLMILGYIIIYTALLCKIYRIMKVTQQPLRRGLKILPIHVLWPFIIVVSLTVGLLIVWSATGSSKYVVYEKLDTNTTVGYCAATPFTANGQKSPSRQILIALQALVNTVQLVLIILACKIRKINQELGDSKRILMLVVFQFIFDIICVSTAPINPPMSILIYTIQMIMSSISTIGFMILPRMYYVWYKHQHGQFPPHVVMIGGGTTKVTGVNPGTGNGAGTGVTPPRIVRNDNNNNNNSDNGNNYTKDDGVVVETAC